MTVMIRLMLLLIVMMSLQGCLNVASSGAQAVYNRHSLQKNLKDQYITMQAYKALQFKSDDFKNANIAITTFNREVLLAGQVPEAWQKAKAEKIVRSIPDIERVYNLLHLESPSSNLTRVSDAWLTGKVKARLLASEDLDATQIKVVTENGTVYLMGILQPQEADAAIDIARNTGGVLSVVKIFSYMQITKKINS
jgi:osmotically-inducible protein OsmY